MRGKLRYFHSCMNAGKSALLLMKSNQFEQCGVKPLVLKPMFDTRDEGIIKSRAIKDERECFLFGDNDDVYSILCTMIKLKSKNGHVVFVDEIQFAKPEHIEQLWRFAKNFGIDVYCFGLKTKASNELFEPVHNLMVYADHVEEIKSMCNRCSNKATTHLMFVEDVPVTEYETSLQVGDIKGNTRYESLCQCCRNKIINGINI